MAKNPVMAGQVHPKQPATAKGIVNRVPPKPRLGPGQSPAKPKLGRPAP